MGPPPNIGRGHPVRRDRSVAASAVTRTGAAVAVLLAGITCVSARRRRTRPAVARVSVATVVRRRTPAAIAHAALRCARAARRTTRTCTAHASLFGSHVVSPTFRQPAADPQTPPLHVNDPQQSASSKQLLPWSWQAQMPPAQPMYPQQSAPLEHELFCSAQQLAV